MIEFQNFLSSIVYLFFKIKFLTRVKLLSSTITIKRTKVRILTKNTFYMWPICIGILNIKTTF